MSDMPKKIFLREVGPREGFQFEKTIIPTTDKVRFIEALSETGLAEIEVTSFVRPDLVPQMADADEVVKQVRYKPGIRYSAIYLNVKGLQRALSSGKLQLTHSLSVSASDAFSKRNTKRTIEETFVDLQERVRMFREARISEVTIGIMAAFGCNFEGDVPSNRVVDLLERLWTVAKANDLTVSTIRLLDTMGWANPTQIRRTAGAIRNRWPEIPISLHLHDTRGLGIANAFAALELGISEFDSAVGGLGGCPFAGNPNAVGNIVTEEFLLLCQEVGIETDVDLDAVVECVHLAETIVGHPLPGKVKSGGNLNVFRRKAKALA